MVSTRIALAAAVLPLLLVACSGADVSRTFGLNRESPDEFQVTTRAPLSMPPDYMLRPPRPGAARPQELSQRQEAESTLAPQAALGAGQSSGVSPGQQALVAAAGPAAPADIRQRLDADAAMAASNRSFAGKLMFWRTPPDPSAVVVDPQREAQRLRENAALGQPPTTGDTPIIQRKKNTLWDALF